MKHEPTEADYFDMGVALKCMDMESLAEAMKLEPEKYQAYRKKLGTSIKILVEAYVSTRHANSNRN
jgi:hypothetical protein